jgi:hypothetical protein
VRTFDSLCAVPYFEHGSSADDAAADIATDTETIVEAAAPVETTAVTVVEAAAASETDVADESAAIEEPAASGDTSTYEIEVWADNWMAVYVDGVLIGEDSVSITTERP